MFFADHNNLTCNEFSFLNTLQALLVQLHKTVFTEIVIIVFTTGTRRKILAHATVIGFLFIFFEIIIKVCLIVNFLFLATVYNFVCWFVH